VLEELIHMLLEEQYEEFTVRSPTQGMAAIHVPTEGMGARRMHHLTGWCLERKLSINLNTAGKEFIVLIKGDQ
jgi:hypothetical protein